WRKRLSSIHFFSSTRTRCMIAIWPAGPPKLMKPSFSQKASASEKVTAGCALLFIGAGRRYSSTYAKRDRRGIAARVPARRRAVAHRAPEPRSEPLRGAARHGFRPAARRGARGQALSGPPRGHRHAERADGAAAGGRRVAGVPPAFARRAARRAWVALHAGRDDRGADRPRPADHRGARAPGARGRVARIRGAAALARRAGHAGSAHAALGRALLADHRRARGPRPRERRGGRGDDRRRQHRRRDARDDDRHRARNLQGRSAARARSGVRTDRDSAGAERGRPAREGSGATPVWMSASILPLSLDNLVYASNGQPIISGVSLAIDAGPSTIILGANGAGKSV